MLKSRSILTAALVSTFALLACPGSSNPDGGACVGAQASCTASSQCCAGYACNNGSCEFVTNVTGGSTGAGNGTGGSTGGNSAGTSGGGASGGSSSGGFMGTCTCSGLTPYCDPVGRCVACTSDSQCLAQSLDAGTGYNYCVTTDTADVSYGSCVQCNTTAQCQTQGGGVCDPTYHGCDPSQNCIDGGASYCTSLPNGDGAFCDPNSGECVACAQDSDCASLGFGTPYCDPGTKSCVECRSPADCPYSIAGCFEGECGGCGYAGDCLANQTCDPTTYPSCVCTGNSGCGGDGPTCEGLDGGTEGNCGCDNDTECGTGNVCAENQNGGVNACEINCNADAGFCGLLDEGIPACDVGSGQCVVCVTNTDCTANGNGSYCIDGGSGTACIACETGGDCADAGFGPFCAAGNCVQCLVDGDCAAQDDAGLVLGPYCVENTCVACNADSQCAAEDAGTPYCSTQSYFCVGCDSYSQCPGPDLGCNSASSSCGGCIYNTDCPPGDGCQFGQSSLASPYCTGMCGLAGAATDGGCVQCFEDSDCGDAGVCGDAGSCLP